MAEIKGMEQIRAYFAAAPDKLRNLARDGLREAAEVVAEEARARCISSEARESVQVRAYTSDDGEQVGAMVFCKGPGSHIARWLEYGTDPHFISVDAREGQGRTAQRINTLNREARSSGEPEALNIGGTFVHSVLHPGSKPYPFLRPAFDNKQDEGLAAAQAYITSSASRRAGVKPT